MPNRSLIVMYGSPRYQYEHSVLRTDINTRRVAIAYRELTPMYLPNGSESKCGESILQTAQMFWQEQEQEPLKQL